MAEALMNLRAFVNRHKSWLGVVAGFAFGIVTTLFTPFFSDVIFSTLKGRWSYPMLEKQIEFVREASARMPCDATSLLAFQGLISNAVELDKVIAFNHEANQHWMSDWSIDDRWDKVELIPLPCAVSQKE